MPLTDPLGVLLAVISATVFTLVIIWVVRSRQGSRDLAAPLTSALGGDWQPLEREFFSTVIIEGSRPGFGLIASTGLHVLVVVGTPLLPYLFPEKLAFDLARYNVKIVEFRVPEPLLYTAEHKPAARRQLRAVIRAANPAEQGQAPKSSGADARRPRLTPKVIFQLPTSKKGRSRDVVIQPDQPLDVPVAIPQSLPRALLWAQAPAPPQESRMVGMIEQPRTLPPFSMPAAPPKVQQPNRELLISDLQIGSAPVTTFRPPQLPVPAANVAPISLPTSETTKPGELPATPLPLGNPTNLIALTQTMAAAASSYLLDVGNRLGESPSNPAAPSKEGAAGEGSKPAGEGKAAGESKAEGENKEAAGAGASVKPGEGSQPAGSSTGPTPPAPSEGPAKGTHADLLAGAPGASTTGGSGAASASRPNPTGSQPPAGSLGIIVVHQSGQDGGLEGSETLTGQPVYTVYFDVPGSPRRWILQYCVPGVSGPSFIRPSESTIRIMPRRNVHPPYPLERIPVDLKGFQGSARRLVIYAMLNERGEIGNIRVVKGAGQEIDRTAVATLQRWAFRPAMRGEDPVAVEALFGIPLQ